MITIKFKKIISVLLSGALCLSCTASVLADYNNYDEYYERTLQLGEAMSFSDVAVLSDSETNTNRDSNYEEALSDVINSLSTVNAEPGSSRSSSAFSDGDSGSSALWYSSGSSASGSGSSEYGSSGSDGFGDSSYLSSFSLDGSSNNGLGTDGLSFDSSLLNGDGSYSSLYASLLSSGLSDEEFYNLMESLLQQTINKNIELGNYDSLMSYLPSQPGSYEYSKLMSREDFENQIAQNSDLVNQMYQESVENAKNAVQEGTAEAAEEIIELSRKIMNDTVLPEGYGSSSVSGSDGSSGSSQSGGYDMRQFLDDVYPDMLATMEALMDKLGIDGDIDHSAYDEAKEKYVAGRDAVQEKMHNTVDAMIESNMYDAVDMEELDEAEYADDTFYYEPFSNVYETITYHVDESYSLYDAEYEEIQDDVFFLDENGNIYGICNDCKKTYGYHHECNCGKVLLSQDEIYDDDDVPQSKFNEKLTFKTGGESITCDEVLDWNYSISIHKYHEGYDVHKALSACTEEEAAQYDFDSDEWLRDGYTNTMFAAILTDEDFEGYNTWKLCSVCQQPYGFRIHVNTNGEVDRGESITFVTCECGKGLETATATSATGSQTEIDRFNDIYGICASCKEEYPDDPDQYTYGFNKTCACGKVIDGSVQEYYESARTTSERIEDYLNINSSEFKGFNSDGTTPNSLKCISCGKEFTLDTMTDFVTTTKGNLYCKSCWEEVLEADPNRHAQANTSPRLNTVTETFDSEEEQAQFSEDLNESYENAEENSDGFSDDTKEFIDEKISDMYGDYNKNEWGRATYAYVPDNIIDYMSEEEQEAYINWYYEWASQTEAANEKEGLQEFKDGLKNVLSEDTYNEIENKIGTNAVESAWKKQSSSFLYEDEVEYGANFLKVSRAVYPDENEHEHASDGMDAADEVELPDEDMYLSMIDSLEEFLGEDLSETSSDSANADNDNAVESAESNGPIYTQEDLELFNSALDEFNSTGTFPEEWLERLCEITGADINDYRIDEQAEAVYQDMLNEFETIKDTDAYDDVINKVFGDWPADRTLWSDEMVDLYNDFVSRYYGNAADYADSFFNNSQSGNGQTSDTLYDSSLSGDSQSAESLFNDSQYFSLQDGDSQDGSSFSGVWQSEDSPFGDSEFNLSEFNEAYANAMEAAGGQSYINDFKSTLDGMAAVGVFDHEFNPNIILDRMEMYKNGFTSINDSVELYTTVDVSDDLNLEKTGTYQEEGVTTVTIVDSQNNPVTTLDSRLRSTMTWVPNAIGVYTASKDKIINTINWSIYSYDTTISCYAVFPDNSEVQLISNATISRVREDVPSGSEVEGTNDSAVYHVDQGKITVATNDLDINSIGYFDTERIH